MCFTLSVCVFFSFTLRFILAHMSRVFFGVFSVKFNITKRFNFERFIKFNNFNFLQRFFFWFLVLNRIKQSKKKLTEE